MSDNLTASTTRNAVIFLAVIAGGAALWWLRGILTPLVLAIFLMVLVDSLTRLIEQRAPGFPRRAATPVALIVCILAFAATIYFLAENTASFLSQIADYGPRLHVAVARIAAAMGVQAPPSIEDLLSKVNPNRFLRDAAQSAQDIVSDAVFVLIYLGFLIASTHGFKRKIITLFPHHDQRDRAAQMFNRIRKGVERYVWVQTLTELIIAAGCWAVMAAVRLDNAPFWAFFIFIAAYIPMIGAAAGILAPALFALLQFDTFWQAGVLLVGLETIFFIVGNVVLPKMQGESLNLDPVVILLSLAFWGAIWGLAGAFLSSPLTVMVMIILAQFPSTRWIAVLLSENGEPDKLEDSQPARGPRR